MTERLFVYGTLAPGRSNAHVLADVPGTWEPATVRGKLVEQGWGATFGFPGIVLSEEADKVHGVVLTADELSKYWAHLDEFEGAAYVRVLAPVKLKSGATVNAFIYTLLEE